MASPSTFPEPEIPQFETVFVVNLDTYTKNLTENNGKTKIKEVKSTKVKEVIFHVSAPNYLDFLTIMLAKHNKSLYKVTEKKRYTFKYLPGASHKYMINYSRMEAMDVDNKNNYAKMAKKIISEKLKKVKIFIDMKNVEKLSVSTHEASLHDSSLLGNAANHESGESEDEETVPVTETGASELEREIARYRQLIIKKWGNDYDNSIMHIHSSGMEIPCTPAMSLTFSQYDGEATTSMPPNIPSFDPAKHEPVLHPMCCAASTTSMAPAPSAISTSDISSLTLMLLLQTVRDLAHNQDHAAIPSTSLPTVNASMPIHSPVILTPSKLTHFLKYAEQELGVGHAMVYESSLHSIGAGPDILVEIADQELAPIGLTPGDIIHLKKGSVTWWNGPLAKNEPIDRGTSMRKDTMMEDVHASRMRVEERPPGECPDLDYDLYHFCDNRQEWVPFPPGYTFDAEGSCEDQDPFR
ncbi:hypothetical protein EV702DRAFT_1196834 [Suillus placidus]|uniref:Uncharacterized protein n=1 Tax=Suillus placidus TaxID=48579 RepID=A0A9P6ZW34_9AGAM|nr:hypothetical protein EV702DRAFT_1196834 [Suillus placidus]